MSLEECIKALESLDRFLARDRVMSSPKSKKLAKKGGKQGYIISLGGDLNETKDREYIQYLIRRMYQSLGVIR